MLIADEPTRGVDVGAKRDLYELLVELAAGGVAILLISNEIEEVLGLAHRVVVMRAGRVVAELAGDAMTEEAILAASFGRARRPRHDRRERAPPAEAGRTHRRCGSSAVRSIRQGRDPDPVRRSCSSILSIISPPFLRFQNLTNILDQQAGIIIVAAAGTLVLIAGGIDLSVGAIYGLAGATAAQLARVVRAAGRDRRGARRRARHRPRERRDRHPVPDQPADRDARDVVRRRRHRRDRDPRQPRRRVRPPRVPGRSPPRRSSGITSAAWMMIVIAIAAAILLSRTTFGRYVYATGGNAEAARLGGVRINTVRVATFALSGMAAALAGTIDASRTLSAQASAGSFLTFTVLTGIIVGGTSILGGEGSVQRTVVGCLFVALVANGFNLLGLDPFYQQVTLGIILLLAVGTDAWSRRPGLTIGRPPAQLRGLIVYHVATSTGRSRDRPIAAVRPSSGLARQVLVGPDAGRRPHGARRRARSRRAAGSQRHVHSFEEALYVLEGELVARDRRRGPPPRRGRLRADADRDAGTRLANDGDRRRSAGCRSTRRSGSAPDAGRKDTFFAKRRRSTSRRSSRGPPGPRSATRRCAGSATTTGRRPRPRRSRVDDPARGRKPAGHGHRAARLQRDLA